MDANHDSQELNAAKLLNDLADELNADFLLINSDVAPGLGDNVRALVRERGAKRPNLFLILVTQGGLADEAYRCGRLLQAEYEHITVCIAGWCKSAGTLLAIAGHTLMFGPKGELGPLDVQITKRDELFDRDSGLISNAALDQLREESFNTFEQFMLKIIAKSQNAITFRTAADVAAELTVGLMSPVYDKFDPLRLGTDGRAMQIGSAYALRLNMTSDNLRSTDALNMLLNGYPSHSFVIDSAEASMLFTRVQPLPDNIGLVIEALGDLAISPCDDSAIAYLDGTGDDDEIEEAGGVAEQAPKNVAGPANDANGSQGAA